MLVSKSNIIEAGIGKCIQVNGDMPSVTAVRQKDMAAIILGKADIIIQILGNLRRMIAETMNFGVQFREKDRTHLL